MIIMYTMPIITLISDSGDDFDIVLILILILIIYCHNTSHVTILYEQHDIVDLLFLLVQHQGS
jgi:hypothetical protein